jgi:uncharacterized protein (DUF4213/DUF364 family)
MIAEELRNYLVANSPAQAVTEVQVGPRYTAAMLEDGHVGVAYTYRQPADSGCETVAGRLLPDGRSVADYLAYLESPDGVERSIGLAVANAVANRHWAGEHEGDLLHRISVGFLDRVGMVGYFGPLVQPLKSRVRELIIFERDTKKRAEEVRPSQEALTELPRCDVAILTATALVFGGLDSLLEAASGCREVALLGPSTPLVPSVFGSAGVTLLSGINVVDAPGMLQLVAEGGGTRGFGQRALKVNVRP